MEDLVCIILDAARTGNGSLLAAALLGLIVFVLRTLIAPRVAFFSSDLGGASLALLTGMSGVVLASVLGGSTLTLDVVGGAFTVSLTAMGGYATVKKLLAPYLVRLAARLGLHVSTDTLTKALQASEPKQTKTTTLR